MSRVPTGLGNSIEQLLEQVRDGQLTTEQALAELRDLPYQDLGLRPARPPPAPLRTGSPEVVLGMGKTPEQVAGIVSALRGRGHPVLVTKTDRDAYGSVLEVVPEAEFKELAGAIVVPNAAIEPKTAGTLVVTAGTADLPVAEEARVTAELMGQGRPPHCRCGCLRGCTACWTGWRKSARPG